MVKIRFLSDQTDKDISDLIEKMRFLTNWFTFLVSLGEADSKQFKNYLKRVLTHFQTNRYGDREETLEKYLQEQKTKFESGIPGISKKEKEVINLMFPEISSKPKEKIKYPI